MKTLQTSLAGTVGFLSALCITGVIYLALVFPRTIAVWADEGRSLPIIKRLLVEMSHFCRSFGLLLVPILLLAVVGCGIWALRAGMANKRDTARKSS